MKKFLLIITLLVLTAIPNSAVTNISWSSPSTGTIDGTNIDIPYATSFSMDGASGEWIDSIDLSFQLIGKSVSCSASSLGGSSYTVLAKNYVSAYGGQSQQYGWDSDQIFGAVLLDALGSYFNTADLLHVDTHIISQDTDYYCLKLSATMTAAGEVTNFNPKILRITVKEAPEGEVLGMSFPIPKVVDEVIDEAFAESTNLKTPYPYIWIGIIAAVIGIGYLIYVKKFKK